MVLKILFGYVYPFMLCASGVLYFYNLFTDNLVQYSGIINYCVLFLLLAGLLLKLFVAPSSFFMYFAHPIDIVTVIIPFIFSIILFLDFYNFYPFSQYIEQSILFAIVAAGNILVGIMSIIIEVKN